MVIFHLNIFHIKVKGTNDDISSIDRPNLSIHLENWKSAEDRPELVDELVQDELDKDWIHQFDGSVEDAQAAFPLGLAIWEAWFGHHWFSPTALGSGLHCSWYKWQLYSEWTPMYAIREGCPSNIALAQYSTRVVSAGLRCESCSQAGCYQRISSRPSWFQPSQFNLLLQSGCFRSYLVSSLVGTSWLLLGTILTSSYFCGSCTFSVCRWLLLLQRKDVLPLTAAFVCSLMRVFGLPISWRKADSHCALDWIGWRFNFSIGAFYLQEPKRSKLSDLISQMISRSRIPKKALETFLGLALWITQIFPQMRSSLQYLFSDLHRPPGTQYSVDPGYWPITVSCLTDEL